MKSITKYAGDFREKYLFVRFLKPDIDLNKQTSKFMNTSHTSFGRVSERESRVEKPIIAVPDITFPVSSKRDNTSSGNNLFSASQTQVHLLPIREWKACQLLQHRYNQSRANLGQN